VNHPVHYVLRGLQQQQPPTPRLRQVQTLPSAVSLFLSITKVVKHAERNMGRKSMKIGGYVS